MTLGVLAMVALGITSDLLVTLYYLAVSRGWVWRAALTSLPIGLLNFYVFDKVIKQIGIADWRGAIGYAIGNAIGCLVIMRAAKGARQR